LRHGLARGRLAQAPSEREDADRDKFVSLYRLRSAIIPDSLEIAPGTLSRGSTAKRQRRRWRYALEDSAFVLAGLILSAMPVEAASWFSGRIWRLLGPRIGNLRHRRTLANLATAFPEKTAAERKAIAAGMWENLGRIFAETFRLAEIAASGRVTVVTSAATPIEPTAGVFCAAHQANWEIAVLGVPDPARTRPAGVYQRIKNPFVDARVRKMRAFLYPGGLYSKSSTTSRQLIRHAREGGALAVLADQRDFRGPRATFFGTPAPSTPFPAMIARSLGLKLYAGEIIRKPNVRFEIRLTEIAVPQTQDRDADILAATAALQAEFERSIRRHPEQWMWSHRRWG
jgi:KDO2-lipid IV(A) lauroyltransferase